MGVMSRAWIWRVALLWVVTLAGAAGVPSRGAQQPALPPHPNAEQVKSSALDQQLRALLPTPEEQRWLEVPWRTNLMAARAEAQRLGRPLFLWVMDGHPLGCT
jgi:hypothetical protein